MRIKLDVFELGKLQDTLTLLNMALRAGITDVRAVQQQIDEHVRTEASQRRNEKRRNYGKEKPSAKSLRGMTTCKFCTEPALVERVNICPSTAIGGRWKSSISCTNPGCLHVEFSEKPVNEVSK